MSFRCYWGSARSYGAPTLSLPKFIVRVRVQANGHRRMKILQNVLFLHITESDIVAHGRLFAHEKLYLPTGPWKELRSSHCARQHPTDYYRPSLLVVARSNLSKGIYTVMQSAKDHLRLSASTVNVVVVVVVNTRVLAILIDRLKLP